MGDHALLSETNKSTALLKGRWRSVWRDFHNSAMICVRVVQVAGAVNSQAANVSGACREAGIRAVRRELIDVYGV